MRPRLRKAELESAGAYRRRSLVGRSDRGSCIGNVWNWRWRDTGANSGIAAGIQPAPGARNESGGADTTDWIAGGDRVRARGIRFLANGIAADSRGFPGRYRGRQRGKKNSFSQDAADFCGADVLAGNIANRERIARMTDPRKYG